MYLGKIQERMESMGLLDKAPDNRMSVAEAACLLGASEQFIRIGLQQGTLKFGMAVKMSGKWTYVITRQKFEEITGIKAVGV